uniref:uncharacterized protein LOC125906394 isoform X1 n=1 Tax=Anopheles coluzzii TaxID=1518534 RepID=UPI0020FFC890|nr:uncharacterized protein LOC125906394 isoform X1 [Anopheles coluzzii]XP_049465270.1 uncharacterized protein LOC125906394 isoform X1 [Anopheles coluzzii]XP_049465271.1 uncharacterized protein LOC125906394 isoform X1 [Anopheles coluzzii]
MELSVTIRERSVDSRTVIEVKGKHIVLSEIKTRIETLLANSTVEEVRIFAGIILTIDVDLSRDVWHGRNLMVLANEIKVCTTVRWNVSGKDNDHTYTSNAGTDGNGVGKQGADGYPGESGGNVLLQAITFQHPERLTIISNGANGSNGQDGGNGKAGVDGKGISRADFKDKFPPTAKFLEGQRANLVETTVKNIRNLTRNIKTQWLVTTMPLFPVNTTHRENVLYHTDFRVDFFDSLYIEVETHDGCEITFSFQQGTPFYNCQSFLMFKGTSGQRGQAGGGYGLGGQGGFAGEVTIKRLYDGRTFDIKTYCNRGNDGENGKGGLYGAHGKNGWDMGYVDYSVADNPVLYGQDEKSKLQLSFYDENSSSRMYCPYKVHIKSSYYYAGLQESRIDHQSSNAFEERNNTQSRTERQHHAKAIGKKSIPGLRIAAAFSEYLQEIERERQQLEKQRIERENQELERLRIEKEKQELKKQREELEKQKLAKQRLEREKQRVEKEKLRMKKQRIQKGKQELERQRIEKEKQELEKQRIAQERKNVLQQQIEQEKQRLAKRQIEKEKQQELAEQVKEYLNCDALQQVVESQYADLDRVTDLDIKRIVKLGEMYKDPSREEIFSKLNNNLNLDDWLQLRTRPADRPELVSLVEHFETLKSQLERLRGRDYSSKITPVTETLKIKYKIAILKEITQELPTYHTTENRFVLTAKTVGRYLEETDEKNDTFYHPVLGTLKQYIFENNPAQRDNINKFIAKASEYSVNGVKRAVETFIMETDSSKDENKRVKLFYDEYQDYLEKQQRNIDAITQSLAAELKKSKHQEAFRLWNESIDDDGLLEDLEELIRKDKVLSSLYDELKRAENAEYDWERCCADEKIQEIFQINLKQEGIMCKSYRILLAYVYDLNIRVYAKDEDNEIVLIEDHNPKSIKITHILHKSNEFTQLKINESYCQLEEERLHKDRIFRRILTEINGMQDIQTIENYFEREVFDRNSSNFATIFEDLEDEITVEKIAAFFSADEKDQIAQRLKNISPKYTGQHGVFESILLRFSFEGSHVSSNELCFLINSILAHTVEARQERYTFSWIVAAYNQCSWTNELVLLQLENCYKRQLQEKPKWRKYMSKIENKGALLVFSAQFTRKPCPAQCVEDILHLLSNIPIESVRLDELELTEWPYVLKEFYWTHKLKALITWGNDSEALTSASFFVLSIENTYGNKLVENLFESLVEKRSELTHSMLLNVLSCFHKQKWNLCVDDLNVLKQSNLFEWIKRMEEKFKINLKELNISQIATIIRGNANTSSKIVKHLSEIEQSVANIHHNKKTIETRLISSFSLIDVEKWVKEFRVKNQKTNTNMYEEMLAVIDRAIELKRGFKLRDTQLLTILALLVNDNSTLAQVSTGEGKSLIVVATAIIKALLGEKVDIITSSSVLAQRDAVTNNDIYELFGLSAYHNCSEQIEERKEAYSCNQIIYGGLGNFQRDYLFDRFYGKHVVGNRSFENVIVDEVDSMLLDKGNNMIYLSHDIAGMDKLKSVYLFIWQMVNTPTDLPEDVHMEAVKRSVLSDMYAIIQKEDIQSLDNALGKSNVLGLWERLVKSGIINDAGRLQTEAIDSNKLEKVLTPDFTQYKDRLSFLLTSCLERETCIKIPNYLKAFVERHLDSWISSAITALYMVPGQYYVVDVYRSGTSADRIPNVIILDTDTGTDQVRTHWGEALHQFLQLKHGCKLSTQSLKAVFISNVTYLNKYKLLYGLTGTLGSQRERHLLEEIHRVDFVTVPTFKSKQFEEYEPIICSGKDDWLKQIHQEVSKLTKTNKRSVLIICETIQDVETLQKNIASKGHTKVRIYVRDYEKLDVTRSKLIPGEVIIATNLAGRGTDIKISDELEEAGGLHVILSYLPANIRIEEQAFGRAARKGERGSGQLIIMANGGIANRSMIFALKQKRNVDELFRISAIKAYYETTIKIEESCFEAFNELYEKKMKLLANAETPEPVKDILLQSCLDRWSFWLDEHKTLIEKASDEASKREVKQRLKHFLLQFDDLKATSANNWAAWVEENPMQIIKLGKYISQHDSKHRNTAMQLFGKVISSEPYFCEAAYYYRAYTRSLDNMNVGDFKKDLRMAEKLLNDHIKYEIHASGIVCKLKNNTPPIEGYEEQKKCLINLYSLFLQSIDDMLGHAVSPESFVNYEIKEDVAGIIFDDLVRIGMIKNAQVIDNIPNDQIQRLHVEYGIPVDQLKKFLAQHRGPIDDKEFLKAIRESFSFPSRSDFWETLINQKALLSVERYVAINEERLKIMDPALMNVLKEKVDKGQLVKAVVKLDKHQILLIHEQQSQFYYEKEKLIDMIGKTKYISLEENGLLSCNEKATIDKDIIADCMFSAFDSITVQDITNRTRITTSEAKNIIAELLKRNVLQKRGETFVLPMNYDDSQDVLLPTYPVYESVVRNVLASCFAYRLALRNIARQLEEENCSDIRIELKPNPHQMFFTDLLEHKIMLPPMATHEIDESKIKAMYKTSWSKGAWISILSKEIGLSQEYTKLLVDVLLKNRWIVPNPLMELLLFSPSNNMSEEIKNALASYRFSSKDDRTSVAYLKSCIASINQKHGLLESYDVGVAIEKWFNNQLLLIENGTAKHIENVLSKSKSSLAAINVPQGTLKSLMDFYGKGNFGSIDEMRIFITNGLEHLLELGERKWTMEMILKTSLVLAAGVAQIAIGAIMEVYSVGMMTHVAGAFIGEGVSDIMFAVGAFKSGYFSWKDYGKHKLQSLLFTIGTAGVGMYLSQGAKMSRIGYKVAGPSLEYGGKRVAESSGKQLIKAVGGRTVVKEIAKCVALKTAESVAFAVANTAVDTVVENHLQSMLNSLASDILSGVKGEVANHKVAHNLQKAYDRLGENDARALVNDLTNAYMLEQNTTQTFLPFTKQISQSVMQGIGKANKKTGTTNSAMVLINQISRVMDCVDRVAQVYKMRNATYQLLDSINIEMERKLANIEQNSAPSKETPVNGKDFERFQREVVEQWETTLSKHVGQLIAQHVVLPVLKMGVNSVLLHVGTALKDIRRSMVESELSRDVHRLKDEHEQKMNKLDMTAETKRQLTEEYHGQMLKIMHKTRSPSLFATIIRENVPMDLTCVGACTPMIHKMLQAQHGALSGLTITVHGEKGIKQSFSSGTGGPEIHLDLKGNHFTFGAGESTVATTGNNCLYGALATAIPDLQAVGEDSFRSMLCDSIQHDDSMHHHIRQGWHRVPLKHGAVGGARKSPANTTNKGDGTFKAPTVILSNDRPKGKAKARCLSKTPYVDDESSTTNELQGESSQPVTNDSRTPEYHLDSRVAHHTGRFAGELKKIAEITNIPVDELIKAGRSMFKASRNCSGQDQQQAHVVRVSILEERLKTDFPDLYQRLTRHAGHTQLVDKFVNVFHKIGGDIDRNQADWILDLATVDFTKGLNDHSREVFEKYKSSVLRVFDNNINSNKYSKEQVLVIKNARKIINNTSTEVLFERAQKGYDFKYEYKPSGRGVGRPKIYRTENEE